MRAGVPMQLKPITLPRKADGGLDRLSCLISRFRVQVAAVKPDKIYIEPTNFFVFEDENGRLRVIFCPQVVNTPGFKSVCTKHISGTVLMAAHIEVSGAGQHVLTAMPEEIMVPLDEAPELAVVVTPIVDEVRTPRCGGWAVLHRLFEVFMIRLLRCVVQTQGTTVGLLAGLAHPRLSVALVSIHEAPDRQWGLEDLADVAGMSRTQFAVTFKDVVGMTPGAYLSNWRLEVARAELASGAAIKSVAKICGFSSTASFSRAFSRRFGHAPKYARESVGA